MGQAVEISVLGSLSIGPQARELGVKQRRVLSALTVAANRTVSADRLTSALWGDRPAPGATGTLHSHVFRLRRHLADAGVSAVVTTVVGGYRLDVTPAQVDALRFEQLVVQAHQERAESRRRQVDLLREALALWRGPAYPDMDDDEVVRAEAARLEELRIAAWEDVAEALLGMGRWAEVMGDLESLVRRYPFRERLVSALILARYRSGRQAEALEAFTSYRQTIDKELGLEPSTALKDLHRDILRQASHLSPEPASDGQADPVEPESDHRPPLAAQPSHPVAVFAERKLVTVLAAELAGHLSDGVRYGAANPEADPAADPEDLAEFLEPVLESLVATAHRFGGTVVQAGVSRMTVLFGAPVAAEDHAIRACRAAQSLQETIRALPGRLTLAIACDSGEVLLREARSDTAEGYEAVGAVVERARRTRQQVPTGAIVLGSGTWQLVEGMVTVEPIELDPLLVAVSPAESVPPEARWSRLISVAATSDWDARARAGLSTLVGRSEHLSRLLDLVQVVEGGQGQVVGVVGAPGVGKSRLLYEFGRRVPANWLPASVAANQLDVAVPLQPLLSLVRQLLEIDAGTTATNAAAAVTRYASMEGAGSAHQAALCAVLGVATPDALAGPWASLDPGVRRRRTIAAIAELVLSQARKGPVALVVEDAHWLDGESLAILDSLVDRISAVPMLLLVAFRPEHDPGWGNRSHFTLLRVDPLDDAQCAELVTSLLGDHPSVRRLRDQLVSWTAGVPLYLEESVRALADTGAIAGAAGHHTVVDGSAPLRLPPRIQGLLAARIDQLPPPQKQLLRTAAVVGTEGSVGLLAEVLGTDLEEIEEDLAGLYRAEFIYERRYGAGRGFVFKHAIVHDAAYASLARQHRRATHARVMDALVNHLGGGGVDELGRLAHHASRAERWAEAVELNSQAGDRALDLCAYREAAALLERALEAKRRVPPSPEREIDLYLQLRPALHALSEFDRMLAHLDRAEQLATESGDESRQLLIMLHRGYLLLTRGHVTAALAATEQALTMAQRTHQEALVAECRLAIGHCLTFAGDPRRVVALIERDMPWRAAAPLGGRNGMAGTRPLFALSFMSICHSLLGEFDRAARRLDEAERIVSTVNRPIDSVVAAIGYGVLQLQRGAPQRALPVLREARSACTDAGMPLIARWVEPALADALVGVGLVAESRACLEELRRAGDTHTVPLWQAAARLGLARADLADGEPERAAEHGAAAVALASTWRYPMTRVVGLRLRAEAAGRQGNDVTAITHATEAVRAAEEIGVGPELARCQVVLADLLDRVGRSPEAARCRGAAVESAVTLGLEDIPPAGPRLP